MSQHIDSQAFQGLYAISKDYRRPLQAPRVALFDFDGTISLIRSGWQQVMEPQFVRHLQACPQTTEDEASLRRITSEVIGKLTGKNTIFQMIALKELVEQRGGSSRREQDYKEEYLAELDVHISERKKILSEDQTTETRFSFLVPGALQLLQELHDRQITMYLASGSDQDAVREEANLLGVSHFFEGRIFGATEEDDRISAEHHRNQQHFENVGLSPLPEPVVGKARVIRDILSTLSPTELIGFGDGCVEIELVRQAGGLAIGVATDEENPQSNALDTFKVDKIYDHGSKAHILLPNFLEVPSLMPLLGIPVIR